MKATTRSPRHSLRDVTDYLPPGAPACFADADGNAVVNPGDRGQVSANIGLCTDLPD